MYRKKIMRNNIILIIIMLMAGKAIDINAANHCIQEETDLLIPANTAIPLVLDYSINSKKAKRGNIVNFKVAQEIYIDDKLAIPVGTLATAEIIKASKRKCWGKSGKLSIKIRELRFSNGSTIALTAPDIEKNGVSKKGNAWTWFWCTIFFIPLNTIPPLCIKGENAEIEHGLTIIANTVETATISLKD